MLCQKIIIIYIIADHINYDERFTSDGLIYVYKTHKVLNLYWHFR